MARRRKRSKKWISRLFFLILLIAAVVVCYFVWEAYFKEKKEVPKGGETGTQVIKPVEKEEEKDKEEEGESIQKEEVSQYDGEDPNMQGDITGAITYLGVSGSDLVVRVNIDQYLTGGSCEINIIKGGEVLYTDLTTVIDSAATSTCEGFNIPVSRLSAGKLQVNINVSSNEKTGIIGGEIEL